MLWKGCKIRLSTLYAPRIQQPEKSDHAHAILPRDTERVQHMCYIYVTLIAVFLVRVQNPVVIAQPSALITKLP
jgi:hypothetical protein